MKKKRILSTLLVGAISLNIFSTNIFANDYNSTLSLNTQISSSEETVYIDSYSTTKRKVDFTDNWKFFLGDNGNPAPDFNDSSWETIDLPHDYSIEQNYSPQYEAESAYLPGGTGWYRKTFTAPAEWENKKVQIDFGGVYMNATVYLNGKELGSHPYGYTAFSFVLPKEILKIGRENVIAVKVDHKTPSSRWYSGSGIYRSVNLTITDQVHISKNGTYITTPELQNNNGKTVIKSTIQNDSKQKATITLKHTIYEGMSKYYNNGNAVATVEESNIEIPANSKIDKTLETSVNNPKLWDTDNPNMYFVRTEIIKDGKIIDTYDTDFGYRYIEFGNEFGFKLNGRPTRFKGVCLHHDQGALGGEAWYRAMERQVEILKEMGSNAIRVTHNPAAKEFIDICNEKGMLVIDEAFDGWVMRKNGNTYDYARWFEQKIGENNSIVDGSPDMTWAEFDIKSMVNQDKNSPAVIMYSLGNEIFEGTANDRAGEYPDIARRLSTWVQEIDSTRPPTFGQNSNNIATGKRVAKVLNEFGGIAGLNYTSLGRYDEWVRDGLLVYHSETASAVNSRGVYDRKVSNGDGGKGDRLLTSYDKSKVGWGATASEAWMKVLQRDSSMGEFVWTGFDYIGEPTPWNGVGPGAQGGWPSPKSSYFGIIDTNGLPKDSYYLYQSLWNDSVNTLHILPTWNREDIVLDSNNQVEVVVYSDAAKVELYLNDEQTPVATATSQEYTTNAGYKYRIWQNGNRDDHTKLYATFNIPYKEGTLKAVAYNERGERISETVGRNIVKTTRPASKLRATVDRKEIKADGDDLAYITIDVTDAEGNIVNAAKNEITISIEGDGRILGADNGRQIDHTSYQSLKHKAGAGQLVVIAQSTKDTGSFKIKATSPGLSPTEITVNTTYVDEENTENNIISYDISRYHYVKLGNNPQLPVTTKVTYKNGKTENKNVTWTKYNPTLIDKEGNFTVRGTIDGTGISISSNITMISDVVALLNYSVAVQKNARSVNLPASRPVILPDGTIINAEFPVEWDMKGINLGEVGEHIVNGKSFAFGKEIPVTATIRVSNGTVETGANVSSSATELEGNPQARLETIRDTRSEYAENKYWSSSSSSKNSNITFTYATVQSLRQVTIYYLTDGANIKAPKEITLQWSPTGKESLTPLQAVASEPEQVSSSNGKTVYRVNYTFDPVEALVIRLNLTNDDASGSIIGLTEVELNLANYSFPISSEDTLSEIIVNGTNVDEYSLENRVYHTEATIVDEIQVKTDNNTAFTILPEKDKIIKILTESEDHTKRGKYEIILGSSNTEENADDHSRDYKGNMIATAPSYAGTSGNEGGPEFAIDNNNETFWHSNWGNGVGDADLTNKPDKRYIQLQLGEEVLADAIRYLPRPGEHNGRVRDYRIDVSTDGDSWQTVSEGTGWTNDTKWKLAQFTSPTSIKYIRLYGVHTYGNPANKFMSAAEIRVRLAKPKTDISQAEVVLKETEFDYTGYEIKPEIRVTLNGKELKYGVDYVIDYENNIEPGMAKLTVRGVVNYSGVTEPKSFKINRVKIVIIGYDPIEVKTNKGVEPKMPEKVIARVNVGPKQEFTVAWDWDMITEDKYQNPGKFVVKGDVAGQELRPEATVVVLNDPKAHNVSTAVSGGENAKEEVKNALPETVTVYFGDGTSKEFPVKWNIEDTDFTTPGNTEVIGKVTIPIEGGNDIVIDVTANVRVVPEGEEVILNDSFTLEEITFNGENIIDWFDASNNIEYILKQNEDIPVLGAKIKDGDNAVLTIIQSEVRDGKGIIRITSEDASRDEIYTITFKPEIIPDKVEYTVTFDANGGTLQGESEVKVPEGAKVSAPEPPTRDRYEFKGWYTDKEGIDEYNFNTPVREDITLYAKWEEIKEEIKTEYIVTFDANGGILQGESQVKVLAGERLSKPLQPIRRGYIFKGWYTDKEGINEYNFNTPVRENFTLYAKWEIERLDNNNNNNNSNNSNNNFISGGGSANIGVNQGGNITPQTKPSKPQNIQNTNKIQSVIVDGGKVIAKDKNGENITIISEKIQNGLKIYFEKDGKLVEKVNGGIKISVPTKETNTGAVVILVYKDGREVIVRDSYLKDGYMNLYVDRDCILKIENRALKFEDVIDGNWFKNSVDFVTSRQLFAGVTTEQFLPNKEMNRAMLATVLHRLSYEPSISNNSPFKDIPKGSYYEKAISWAAENKIVAGINNNEFAPESPITREQLVSILYRYSNSPVTTVKGNNFSDKNQISSWANDAVDWAVENGILSGRPDGTLDPKGKATRAEVSSILMRLVEKTK